MSNVLRHARQLATPTLRQAAGAVVHGVRLALTSTWAAMVTAEVAVHRADTTDGGRPAAIMHAAKALGWPLVAAVLLAITAANLNVINDGSGQRVLPQVILLASVLSVAPLLLRRRAPLAAFRLSLLTTVVAVALTAPLLVELPLPIGAVAAVPVCLFAAVERARQDIAIGSVVAGLTAVVLVGNTVRLSYPDSVWVFSAAVIVGTVVFGATVRSRRLAQGALLVEEGRTARQQAARAVLEERTRIARELHDVVAHHMSVIAIQAEAAPLRAAGDAEALTAELAEIRTTALDSMREMRRILGVLREESATLATAPAPGLDDLDDLVSTARAAGLSVQVEVLGTVVPLPGTVGLSAYRLVQESLANAMRHAPGSTVAITITYRTTPAVLAIDVHSTPGRPDDAIVPGDGPTHGLVGMRERVSMLGGDLSAGPAADGGFLVQARLPLEEA